MQPYERFSVWRKAHQLAVLVNRQTTPLLGSPHTDCAIQLRRAALSISSNIVEGSARASVPTFAHFLEIALGSAREAAYLIDFLAELEVLSSSDHAKLEARADQLCRMLVALLRTLRARHNLQRPAKNAARTKRAPAPAEYHPTASRRRRSPASADD